MNDKTILFKKELHREWWRRSKRGEYEIDGDSIVLLTKGIEKVEDLESSLFHHYFEIADWFGSSDAIQKLVSSNIPTLMPRQKMCDIDIEGSGCKVFNLVVPEGKDISVKESIKSGNKGGKTVFFLELKEGAKVTLDRYIKTESSLYSVFYVIMHRDSMLDLRGLLLAGGSARLEYAFLLKGEGARLQVGHFNSPQNRDRHLVLFQAKQVAANTNTQVNLASVLKDYSYSLHHAQITIEKNAKGSESSLKTRQLLLTKDGRADSIPKLVIDTDDVKAGHGAVVSEIEDDVMFYLRSRGIGKEVAESLVAEGVAESVLRNSALSKELKAALEG